MTHNYFHFQWLHRVSGEIKSQGTWYFFKTTGEFNARDLINDVIRRYDLPADAHIEITEVQQVKGMIFLDNKPIN